MCIRTGTRYNVNSVESPWSLGIKLCRNFSKGFLPGSIKISIMAFKAMLSPDLILTLALSKFVADFCPTQKTENFFSEVFHDLMQRPLNEIIQSCSTGKGICRVYQDNLNKILQTEMEKQGMKRALHGCFILVRIALSEQGPWTLFETIDDLLVKYPSFSSCSSGELEKLLIYRNYMAVSVVLKRATKNTGKDFHMDICTRLSEGCDTKYNSGSWQSPAMCMRVKIYETEGGVTKKKRVRYDDNGSTSCESSDSSPSKRSCSGSISVGKSVVSPSLNTAAELAFNPEKVFSDPYITETDDTILGIIPGGAAAVRGDRSKVSTVSLTPASLGVTGQDCTNPKFSGKWDWSLFDDSELEEEYGHLPAYILHTDLSFIP